MSGQTPRKPVPPVETIVGQVNELTEKELTNPVVTIPLEEYELLKAMAEQTVLGKAKDAVVKNKKRIAMAAGTVALLGAAAYAVTHKDSLLEVVEDTAQKTELEARDVKNTAKRAQTRKA